MSWDDLGAILASSWAVLGVKIVLSPRAALIFSKIDVLAEKWCQDACWDDLGSIWAPKRVQKGGQKGPKRHQKRDENDIEILIDFWIDF